MNPRPRRASKSQAGRPPLPEAQRRSGRPLRPPVPGLAPRRAGTPPVLALAELGGVDEQAHDDHVRLFASGLDQAQVPRVEGAHRRHEADQLSALRAGSSAARRSATVRTTWRLVIAQPPARGSALGQRLVERPQLGRLLGERFQVKRHRFLVAAGDRPGERSAPASAQFAAVRRTSGARTSRASSRRRTPSAAQPTPRARSGSSRPWMPQRGRRRGPPRERRTAASRAARRAPWPLPRSQRLEPERRTARPPGRSAEVGMVWRGWSENVSQPSAAAAGKRAEASCAADVADESRLARDEGAAPRTRPESHRRGRRGARSRRLRGRARASRSPRRGRRPALRPRSSRPPGLRPRLRRDPRERAQGDWWRRCGRVPVLARENPDGWCCG